MRQASPSDVPPDMVASRSTDTVVSSGHLVLPGKSPTGRTDTQIGFFGEPKKARPTLPGDLFRPGVVVRGDTVRGGPEGEPPTDLLRRPRGNAFWAES